jgi:paraquat-inducible protein B
MSKPKSAAIGAVIVGAIILVFAALIFFSGGQLFSHKERVIMYFGGSVQGLQIGAPIKLKGVVLGEITDIQINFQSDDKNVLTAVTAELALQRINRKGTNVDRAFFEESIAAGLRAQLKYQSFLTGLLYVELDFFPDSPLQIYGFQKNILELPTKGTEFEEIAKSLQELNIKGIVDNLDRLTKDVSKLVASGAVEKTLGNVNNAAESIEKTATGLRTDVNQVSQQFTKTTDELTLLLKSLNQQAPEITKNLNLTLTQLQESLEQFRNTAQAVDNTFAEDSPLIYQLNNTLQDVSRSANALRNLSDTLEQQPESLLRGKKSLTGDN